MADPTRTQRTVAALGNAFTGWRFAAFFIALLIASASFMLALLFVPDDIGGALGRFVVEFKTWCFSYDPATGQVDWPYVAVMILNPLMLVGIVWALWARQLRDALGRQTGAVARAALVGVAVVLLGIGGLYWMTPEPGQIEPLAFPADRLRTELEPPQFSLTDHRGQTVSLDALRGKVVLLTAVYADCHTACPMIITQMKRTVAELGIEETDDFAAVAITLDPERDTPKKLASTARHQGLSQSFYHLVTGEPKVVNDVLDELNVSRKRDPQTGEIGHSNLFALIDRQGRIAYRLTLSDRHAHWLTNALRILLDEPPKALAQRR